MTGKRRQLVVESEEAGWLLIEREQLQAEAEREQAIRSGQSSPLKRTKGLTLEEQAFDHSWDVRWQFFTAEQISKIFPVQTDRKIFRSQNSAGSHHRPLAQRLPQPKG